MSNEYTLLSGLGSPSDIRSMSNDELSRLCSEIRTKMIGTISQNGGHLASNLGTVELTIALHLAFDSPHDKLIFDVGHQCYTHKLITGRFDEFDSLRLENGLSGFTKPGESEHDIFVSGHSSTSISNALGLAYSNRLNGDDAFTVAVIGDGALSGGLAYEAMNNIDKNSDLRLIVVLNDNKMSISENVGAMARHLAVIRSSKHYYNIKSGFENLLKKIPIVGTHLRNFFYTIKKSLKNIIYNSNIFEDMGFAYLGPIDGHNIELMHQTFELAKRMKRPVLVHINTIKGKGYPFAEDDPASYHGVSKLDAATGEQAPSSDTFSVYAGNKLCKIASENKKICAVSAAMTEGVGLSDFAMMYPERFFDVGIAEGHAVTFSAGLAKGGFIPVFAVYSTFLQRGYDQLIHDLALQPLKCILLIDRAGFVGSDGITHQGLFDVAFLSGIPNTEIYSPATFSELDGALDLAVQSGDKKIFAIRYPRGGESKLSDIDDKCKELLNWRLFEGKNGLGGNGKKTGTPLIITYGRITKEAAAAQRELEKNGITADILKLTKIHPIPTDAIKTALEYENIFFFEEALSSGGIGEHFLNKLNTYGYGGRFTLTAVSDCFVQAAPVKSCLKRFSLDCDGMVKIITEQINGQLHET